jgi:hypothetical protein
MNEIYAQPHERYFCVNIQKLSGMNYKIAKGHVEPSDYKSLGSTSSPEFEFP